MATTFATRSRRRSSVEGNPYSHVHVAQALARARHGHLNQKAFAANSGKRAIDTFEPDFEIGATKNPRLMGIAVEIPARLPAANPIDVDTSLSNQVPTGRSAKTVAASDLPTTRPTTSHTAISTVSVQKTATIATTVVSNDPAPTCKPQSRVAKTLKNELNSLKAAELPAKEQGRKLRSKDGTRYKSELSAYFPEYDEVIGNDPKEHHVLNPDIVIEITDSHSDHTSKPALAGVSSSSADAGIHQRNDASSTSSSYLVRGYGDALFTDLVDAQTIDFSFLEARYSGKDPEDTLFDSVFLPAHKKAERLERSIRNSEKGRAQHEKDQIIRLLDSLQGHDWLRIMGVSGVTDSKKKAFQPARAHFVRGCQAILEKFRSWAAEEKRRKLNKKRALAVPAMEDEDLDEDFEGGDHEDADMADVDEEVPDSDEDQGSGNREDDVSDDGDPPESDVDASVTKQLREEAIAAAKSRIGRGRGRGRGTKRRLVTPEPPPTYKPFTSFFDKKYQRDAALSKVRRKGSRSTMAWGQAVPDVPELEFMLPEELRDEEVLRARARRKRREKRGKH